MSERLIFIKFYRHKNQKISLSRCDSCNISPEGYLDYELAEQADGSFTCQIQSCPAGYHSVSTWYYWYYTYLYSCQLNMCFCYNGIGDTGENCVQHDTESCATCDPYYHLDRDDVSGYCWLNQCTCENGVFENWYDQFGKYQDICFENGANYCTSCDDGYMLQVFNTSSAA